MFVTVEGIEGSGKSTLIAGLSQRMRDRGRSVVVTREPGGTSFGDAIRRMLLEGATCTALAEALLVNAARAEHVASVVRPALDDRRDVLCDRFLDSTLAYQGFGRGLDLAMLARLGEIATGGLMPDRTYVLDIPLALMGARLAARGGSRDRVEAEDDAFHERVRAGFLHIAASGPRYRLLNGALEQDELLEHVLYDLLSLVAH